VFVIMWGLCLLLCGVVFVIMWGLCLLLCGWLCLLLCGGCVCYYVGVVFVVVIFVWLLKFNNIVLDEFGEVWGWSFVWCCLCQFEISALDKGFLDFWVSPFFCLLFCCVSIVFEVH